MTPKECDGCEWFLAGFRYTRKGKEDGARVCLKTLNPQTGKKKRRTACQRSPPENGETERTERKARVQNKPSPERLSSKKI